MDYITNEFPKDDFEGYRENDTIKFDFSTAKYKYINLCKLIHSFNLDLNDTHVAHSKLVRYLMRNAIINTIRITDLNGALIFEIPDYYMLYLFANRFLNTNLKQEMSFWDYRNTYPLTDLPASQDKSANQLPFYEKMFLVLGENIFIEKDFKIEIILNKPEKCEMVTENWIPLVGIPDLYDSTVKKGYRYFNSRMYYEGSDTANPSTKLNILCMISQYLRNTDAIVKTTWKFEESSRDYCFFTNDESRTYTDNIGGNNSGFRGYTGEQNTPVRIQTAFQRWGQLQVTEDAEVGHEGSHLYSLRHGLYEPPTYVKIYLPQEKITMDYGYMYIDGQKRNHVMHTFELIEKMKSIYGVDIVENLRKLQKKDFEHSEFVHLMNHFFFTMVQGHHPTVDVHWARPVVREAPAIIPSKDRMFCVYHREKNLRN